MLLTPRRRTRKPSVAAQFNRRHPLLDGATPRYVFAFNDWGGGGTVNGSIRNHALPLTATTLPTHGLLGSTTDMTWFPRGDGCLNSTGGGTSDYIDCGPNSDTTGEIWWVCHFRPTDLTGLKTIFGQNTISGDESIDSIYLESSKVSWWTYQGASAAQILNGGATLSVDTRYRFAGRRSGAAGSWTYTTWINEVQDDTATTASNPATNGSGGNFRLMFAGLYNAARFSGDFEFFALGLGAPKDDAMLGISLNPWQLWGSSPKRSPWKVPAAPAAAPQGWQPAYPDSMPRTTLVAI